MDTTKEIVLTPEGRQKLVDELAYREGEKHDEIVERIKEARGFGDLSENSEYDAAKEEQSHMSPVSTRFVRFSLSQRLSRVAVSARLPLQLVQPSSLLMQKAKQPSM